MKIYIYKYKLKAAIKRKKKLYRYNVRLCFLFYLFAVNSLHILKNDYQESIFADCYIVIHRLNCTMKKTYNIYKRWGKKLKTRKTNRNKNLSLLVITVIIVRHNRIQYNQCTIQHSLYTRFFFDTIAKKQTKVKMHY